MRHYLLLSLLLTSGTMAAPVEQAQWQACRQESSPLVRLACYDALGSEAEPNVEQANTRSAPWQAILRQEAGRSEESAPFLLQQDESAGTFQLTRPALRGATLAIACVNSITHLRIRLDVPWSGDQVKVALDGQAVRDDRGWFIRDKGWLLEYGRGLPAIEDLKRWIGHRELQVQAANGTLIRVDLSGLKEALQPVRQQCRW